MSFFTNLLDLPFLILTWLVETYLFLVAARLVIAAVPSARQSQFYHQLKLLTDPLPNAVRRVLSKWTKAICALMVALVDCNPVGLCRTAVARHDRHDVGSVSSGKGCHGVHRGPPKSVTFWK